MHLHPGVRVDRYTLIEPLGRGGQGAVWKVHDPLDGSLRALKLFFLGDLDAAAAERARREARAVAGASHPALVPCRALFEVPAEGLVGLVFDFVQGEALTGAAARMSLAQRGAALGQLAAALAHVHGLGLVHRDLKPANVLVTDAFWGAAGAPGGVRLIDFGIAARAGNPRPLTATGSVIGTVAYMSPELLAPGRWLPLREGFSRDVFAFGVLACELVCGAHPTGLAPDAPVEAFIDAYFAAEQGHRPWPPPAPDAFWAEVLRACLAIQPRQRPVSGAALLPRVEAAAAAARQVEAAAVRPRPGAPQHAAPSRASMTDTHLGPTELQVHPARASWTGPRPSDPHRTTPMPSPPSAAVRPSAPTFTPSPPSAGARRSAATPVSTSSTYAALARPRPEAQPPGKAARSALLVAVGLALGVAASAGAAMLAAREEPEPDEETPAILPAAPRSAAVRPDPPPPADPPRPLEVTPCCKKQGDCLAKGMTCQPAPCEDVPLPDRSWWLRLTGVARRPEGERGFSEDMAKTHPAAEACMRRTSTGEEICIPFTRDPHAPALPIARLPVTTGELVRGEIMIRVLEAGATLLDGRAAENRDWLKSGVLCQGMLLYVGEKASAPARLGVALDAE
ncbi:serine/threonine-protein kinase [Sorangium cellulosum]|uniref:serine/threonine-protein kinase n=1 Tax=Sorangium cellulosum TaxID=56 RepID=UPI001331159D|nr:serine/threonine-protein kinase [Sorangium cellulosum]